MKIFGNDAYLHESAVKNYSVEMKRSHPGHILPPDSPYFGSGNKVIALEEKIGAENATRAGTFEHVLLQALDKVSGAQQNASELQTQAIIDPDSVDIHDVSLAQAQAEMAIDIAQRILSRMVQGWRDLINTR